ncbi:Zinc finger protein ZAT5, partial [Cucurbita argyrosperma subsp. sororia]
METPQEFMGSNDQIHIIPVKSHRNKRMKLLSGGADATSSSSCGGGGGAGDEFAASSSVSDEVSTEEEEDMANCLILLAQGDTHRRASQITNKRLNFEKPKAGFYVYECKTCNRSFPSFQALGGHRASHKKPKPITAVEESEEPQQVNKAIPIAAAAVVVQIPIKTETTTNSQTQKSGKIHECSICGLEFSSGQALGGHMRRHRTTTVSTNTDQHDHKRRNILELDLNLPAPEEDLRETKFQFTTAPQTIVFAAPTLVDCHY